MTNPINAVGNICGVQRNLKTIYDALNNVNNVVINQTDKMYKVKLMLFDRTHMAGEYAENEFIETSDYMFKYNELTLLNGEDNTRYVKLNITQINAIKNAIASTQPIGVIDMYELYDFSTEYNTDYITFKALTQETLTSIDTHWNDSNPWIIPVAKQRGIYFGSLTTNAPLHKTFIYDITAKTDFYANRLYTPPLLVNEQLQRYDYGEIHFLCNYGLGVIEENQLTTQWTTYINSLSTSTPQTNDITALIQFNNNAFTHDVYNLSYMLYCVNCKNLNVDISRVDFSNIISLYRMLYKACIKNIQFPTIINCPVLTSLTSTYENFDNSVVNISPLRLTNIKSPRLERLNDAFYNIKGTDIIIDISNNDFSQLTTFEGFCSNDGEGISNVVRVIGLNDIYAPKLTNCVRMFYNCNMLTYIDLSGWRTSASINCSAMFYNCNKLEKVVLPSFGLCVSNATNMFKSCTSLVNIDNLDKVDFSRCTAMESMFDGCENLETLIFGKSALSLLTNMKSMFNECTKMINIDLSQLCNNISWQASGVDVSNMFAYCSRVEEIHLGTLSKITWSVDGSVTSQEIPLITANNLPILKYCYCTKTLYDNHLQTQYIINNFEYNETTQCLYKKNTDV